MTNAQIAKQIEMLQAQMAKNNQKASPKAKQATTKAASVKKVSQVQKVAAKVAPVVKKANVKTSPAKVEKTSNAGRLPNLLANGESEVRHTDKDNRLRFYAKDVDAANNISINGIKHPLAVDGKGRFTGSKLGASAGDAVQLTKIRKGVFEAKILNAKQAAKVQPKATKQVAKASPAKVAPKVAPKVAKATPKASPVVVKKVAPVVVKKLAPKKSAQMTKSAPKAKLEVKPKQTVAKKATVNVPKVSKVVNTKQVAAKVETSPKTNTNGITAKRIAGETPEFKKMLVDFRNIVKQGRAEGVSNEHFEETDGRRFMRKSDKRAFNEAATKAGFYGLDGLKQAGALLLS